MATRFRPTRTDTAAAAAAMSFLLIALLLLNVSLFPYKDSRAFITAGAVEIEPFSQEKGEEDRNEIRSALCGQQGEARKSGNERRTEGIMASSKERPTLARLLEMPRDEVLNILGPIYEKSPWVAESFCDRLGDGSESIETVRQLASAMAAIVDSAPREKKLHLLRSHPDLCEKVEKLASLTEESQEEQSRAGLHTLTQEEREKFLQLNGEYRDKFGFPFILAVRNASKFTVLSAVEGRVGNDSETEFAAAIVQVHKIAWMRLLAAIHVDEPRGFLTCHVLDTANGCPAASMRIRLQRVSPPESAGLVGEYITNDDGRLTGGPALKGSEFQVGVYEWTFYVADYFARKGNKISGTPFLDEVPIRFGIDDPDEHYHVPLLVSPWSFSTYRGS